jgi:hypothetical protein
MIHRLLRGDIDHSDWSGPSAVADDYGAIPRAMTPGLHQLRRAQTSHVLDTVMIFVR